MICKIYRKLGYKRKIHICRINNGVHFNVQQLSGVSLIKYKPNINRDWINLLNCTKDFGVWDENRLNREILSILIKDHAYFAVVNNTLVSCLSICYQEQFKPYALLNYFVTLPKYRGRGIGSYLLMNAINEIFNEGYPGLYAITYYDSIQARTLYKKLGFKYKRINRLQKILLDALLYI